MKNLFKTIDDLSEHLNDFIEPITILELLKIEPESSGVRLLEQERPPEMKSQECLISDLKEHGMHIAVDYGRMVTITFSDKILGRYTEKYIRQVLRANLLPLTRECLLVPDISPEGRLHYHGLFNLKTLKDLPKIKRLLKVLGYNKICLSDKLDSVDYLFKIYEQNKKTPKYLGCIESLTQLQVIEKPCL